MEPASSRYSARVGAGIACGVLAVSLLLGSQEVRVSKGEDPLPYDLEQGWEIVGGVAGDLDELWGRMWRPVSVPGTWRTSGIDVPDGHAWYRVNVWIPQSLSGFSLGLQLPTVHDVDQVFLNGERIGTTGSFPPHSLSASLYPRIYQMPAEAIRFGAFNEVIVHVYSATGYGGLVGAPPRIDLYSELLRRQNLASHALVGFSVLFAMVGANHLVLFLLGLPSSRSNLLFSLFAFASSVYALTFSTEIGLGFLGLETAVRMNGALLPLCLMSMCAFLFSFFEREMSPSVVVQLLVLAGVAAVAIAAPTVVDPWIYLIVGALAVVVAGSVVWMLGDSIRRRRPFARPITAAVAVIGFGGLADLLSALGLARPLALNVGGLVFPLAFVPFYAVMAGIFVYGYWRSYRESTIDTLTGLMQRHFFLLRLGDEVARAVRSEQVLTVAMIDLDKFKSINDTLSHSVGDRVLRATSQAIKGATRQFDLVGRYGGDELCLAMSTPREEEALAVLERVRSSVEAQRVTVGDREVGLTISVGAVMCDHCVPDMSHTRLMELADTAVYRAKAEGGNRLAVTRIEPDASSSSIRRIQLDPVIE